MTNTNQFALLWSLGYHRLCPIVPPGAPLSERSSLYKRLNAKNPSDERGKAPGIKWADGTWSGFDFVAHESTQWDCERWHAMGAGVGIKTGQGLVLIDADTKNEAHAKTIRDTIETQLGHLPVRIGNYPKAGYLVRTDVDFQYTRIEFGQRDEKGRLQERVEILAEGRQFVAVGIHPITQQPYRWPDGVPALESVPFVSGAALRGLLEALRPLLPAASEIVQEGAQTDVDQASLLGDMTLVRRAVSATPNTSAAFPTRESYRDFGYAIKAAAGVENEPEAFEIFSDWCARWTEGDNDPDIVAADWHRMKPPFRRGANWLYELAEQHGEPGAFTMAERWFEPVSEDAPLFPENLPNAFSEKKRKFVFEDFYDAADSALTETAAPLIKGLLDQGAMSIVYGASNVGKTFVVLDMAYHIGAGLSYAGLRTAKGLVVYISAEGGSSIKKRIAALNARYGREADVAFKLLRSSIDLRRPDADLRPLIAAIKSIGQPVALIVIDTLSRALAGGDENSSVDMGLIVTNFDALRQHTEAHLMVVHHSGKNQAAGARGHSLLRAATDTELEIAEGVIEAKKQRDLDKDWQKAFALDVHTLGVDRDGDPVTSCTVRFVDRIAVPVGELTPAEASVFEAVTALDGLSEIDAAGVSVEDLAEHFEARGEVMPVNSIRQHLKRMVGKGVLRKNGRGRWSGLDVRNSPETAEKVVKNLRPLRMRNEIENGEVVESGQGSGQGIFQ